MDKNFTPELKNTEKKVRASLRNEVRLNPKESTLEFIKNFARNFRIDKDTESSIQGFILN